MPQMAPLFWLNLFFFFITSFLIFFIMNYFMSPPMKLKIIKSSKHISSKSWKW
nr:ATP synthase F0 subunit 8 [Neoglyphea inopinata]